MAVPQLNLLPDVKKDLVKAQIRRNLAVSVSFIVVCAAGGLVFLMLSWWGVSVGLKAVAEGNIKKYSNQIKSAQNDKSKSLNEYLTIQNDLNQITSVKSQQEQMSRVFQYILSVSPAGRNYMTISSMKVNGNVAATSDSGSSQTGTIVVEGRTVDYAALDVIKLTMQRAKIEYTEGDDDDSTDGANQGGSSDSSASSNDSNGSNGSSNSDETKKDVKSDKLFTDVQLSSVTMSNDADERGGKVGFTLTLKYNPVALAYTTKNARIVVPKETISDSRENTPGVDDNQNSNKPLFNGTSQNGKSKEGANE